MTLAAKLALAAKDCARVGKDGANGYHHYRYASAANVLAHVNEALCAHGIAVIDTLPEILSTEGVGKERVVTARVTLTVADTESEERAVFRGLGSGSDSGDKAVMKAQTAALKYAWLTAFSISTGDDPEADEGTDQRTSQGDQRRNDTPRKPTQQHPSHPSRPQQQRPAQQPARTQQPSQPARPAQPEQTTEVVPDAAPAEMHPALQEFTQRLTEIELPGEGVAVWLKHRAAVSELSSADRETAWKAICARVEEVGKFKNAKTWLKKAIAEEDARRNVGGADHQAA